MLLRTLQGAAAATAAGTAADGAAAVAASAGPSADVTAAAEAKAEAAVAAVASDRAKDGEGSTADVVPGTADLPMASAEACPVFHTCVALALSQHELKLWLQPHQLFFSIERLHLSSLCFFGR